MIAYILDNADLHIKDIIEFETFEFIEDIEYTEKSKLTVPKKPNAKDDDLVFCKDENKVAYIGICENYKGTSNGDEYQIILKQKENLFDRKIFVSDEELISATGIEDFIAKAITDNYIDSGDEMLDKKYINVLAVTHTLINAKVSAENGIYNLKTYLGNAKQYYGIFLDFQISNGTLEIRIYKDDEPEIPIDIEVSDVSDYTETYEVSVLAKLMVRWKIPDAEDSSGNIIVGAVEDRTYYLLADRSVTEDGADENRAAGTVDSIYIEAETEEEMRQQVTNQFISNEYNHKIAFSLNKSSRLYPYERFYVGRKCRIKTKTGVKTSLVTKSKETSDSGMTGLTFGNLKVTMIEKLRGRNS